MGNYVNKFLPHNEENEKVEVKVQSLSQEILAEKDCMCTPPISQRKFPIDPRSVSAGIERTPIEVDCTPVGLNRKISAIPKHMQRRPYLETDLDRVIPQLSPKKRFVPRVIENAQEETPTSNASAQNYLTPTVSILTRKIITPIDKERYKVLGLDPRSPAADFDRTPILMPKSIELLKSRSQENISRRGSYETDIYCPRYSYCETFSQFTVPEIQALPDMAVNAIRSLNLVDIEYDGMNDSSSSCSSPASKTETVSESGEEVTVIENIKLNYAKGNDEMCLSPILSDQKVFTLEKRRLELEDDVKVVLPSNCEKNIDSDRIKVWRDSISSEDIEGNEVPEADRRDTIKERPRAKEEVIITFDNDSIIKEMPPSKTSKTENDYPKRTETNGKGKKSVKTDIKIMADERRIFSSDSKNTNENSKTRTPLGNRSNNGQLGLSAKSPQQLFRNKGITPKMHQENTPPHKRCIVKSKLSGIQWDPDSTVII